MLRKMIILIIITLLGGISSTAYSEEGDWIQAGDGSSYEEALKNAKWNIITKAMEKAIGDQATDFDTIKFFKEQFNKDQNRYLKTFNKVSESKDGGRYTVKIQGIVELSSIRNDSKSLIKDTKTGGQKDLPSISIKISNEKIEGNLAEKFKTYGYKIIDHKKLGSLKDQSEDKLGKKGTQIQDIDYLVESPVMDYKDDGIDTITGESKKALSFRVAATEMLNATTLADVTETVKCKESPSSVDECLNGKAVDLMFNRVNSQILDSWKDTKKIFSAFISGVDQKTYDVIADVIIEMTGDKEPEEKEIENGYKILAKMKEGGINRENRKNAEKALREKLGIDVKIENRKLVYEKK